MDAVLFYGQWLLFVGLIYLTFSFLNDLWWTIYGLSQMTPEDFNYLNSLDVMTLSDNKFILDKYGINYYLMLPVFLIRPKKKGINK